MTLTQEQIKKISKNLSKIDTQGMQIEKDLNDILDYFKLIDEIDTKDVEPTYCVISKENKLREDEISQDKINRKELLECSEEEIISDQIAISNIMK